MSLINDALKRASRSQEKIPPPPSQPPLRPVESKSSGAVGWLLPVAIIFLLAAACFFIWLAVASRATNKISAQTEVVVPPPTQQIETISAPAPTPVAVVTPAPVAAPVPSTAAATNPPASQTVAATAISTPPVAREIPLPKLEGIFYDPAKPWAIADGKTIYVGNRVGDLRVKQITKYTVVFETADGSEKTLELVQ